ncbi:MAG: T9SS type A sorting domain-containing protein, partial [Flavobacteriales bacterium]
TNDGVLFSINSGTNWSTAVLTGIPAGEAIWSFSAAKSGPTTRFFCLTGDPADIYVGLPGSDYWGFYRGIYTCDYGVTNWTSASTGITANDYPMFIGMAENNITTAYISGSNDNSEPIVMKTTNVGGNWNHVLITNSNQNVTTGWSGDGGDRGWSYGECPFGMAVCPTDPNYVMIGDFGFPHLTSNGGTSWAQAYVDVADANPAGSNTPVQQYYHSVGIENTTSWQLHWMNATNMWSCFSDIRGIRSQDAGDSWSFDYTGYSANSSYRIVQNTAGTLFMATSNIHDMYQSTRLQDAILDGTDANGKIMYSTNNGASWTLLHNFNHPVFWIVIDPNNQNRAYASVIHYNGGAGVGGVYRCDDLNNLAGSTWTLLSDPPGTEKHPASLVVLNDGTLVATYSGRRTSGGVFTASSGVFSYNPTSGNWTDLSHAGMAYWTKDVVIDPNDATQNTWYVCVFSGWGGAPNGLGGLYKSVDRGLTWNKLTGSTLDRVTSCTFNPTNANEMFITTEGQGLWMSSTINSGTPTFSQVANYPFRQPERVFFNPYDNNEMWVTSFGNGLKVGQLLSGVPEFENTNVFEMYPNPATQQITVVLNSKDETNINVYSATGKLILQKNVQPGENKVDVSVLVPGLYVVQVGEVSKKLVINP